MAKKREKGYWLKRTERHGNAAAAQAAPGRVLAYTDQYHEPLPSQRRGVNQPVVSPCVGTLSGFNGVNPVVTTWVVASIRSSCV